MQTQLIKPLFQIKTILSLEYLFRQVAVSYNSGSSFYSVHPRNNPKFLHFKARSVGLWGIVCHFSPEIYSNNYKYMFFNGPNLKYTVFMNNYKYRFFNGPNLKYTVFMNAVVVPCILPHSANALHGICTEQPLHLLLSFTPDSGRPIQFLNK